jgi:hypothetical protein
MCDIAGLVRGTIDVEELDGMSEREGGDVVSIDKGSIQELACRPTVNHGRGVGTAISASEPHVHAKV